ncbi:MAG: IPT/TIG domain-containing protein [Myxococcota bacterium]|nr:IPT/TIG domain-containing protein [Myxococcota bacterium]
MFWLLSLTACDEYGFSSENTDTAYIADSEENNLCDGALCIDEISPSWGPSSGGTEVRIKGSGFDGNVGVAFGRFEITDMTRLGPNELFLYSPEFPEGTVDVTVWSDYGEVVVPEGFTYSDSGAPVDTGNSGSGNGDGNSGNDTGNGGGNNGGGSNGGGNNGGGSNGGGGGSTNPTGLTGGLIELSLIVDGFMLATTQGYSINASAMLHAPVNGSWLSWIPPKGSCAFNTISPLSNAHLDIGTWAYLNTPAGSIPLQNTGTSYTAPNLTPEEYTKGASHDFSAPDIGLDIFDAVVTAKGLGTSFGPTHFFAGGDYSFNLYSPISTAFTWDVDNDAASSMLFIIEVLDGANPTTSFGSFQCHSTDSGYYQIPATLFDGAIYGDILIIQMLRIRQTTSIHPQNGSTIEGFSMTGGIGIAFYAP